MINRRHTGTGRGDRSFSAGCVIAAFCILTSAHVAAEAPAIIQSVKDRDPAQTRALIDRGVDVNEPQSDGATALHWAVHRNDLDAARLLVEAGANVDAANDFGIVPMWLACENRNAEIAKLLLEAGVDPSGATMTGESLLMAAAHHGGADVVRRLLEAGADVNVAEPVRGQTALMWAIGEDHTDIALMLIEADADVNAKTTFSFTPLMFAARKGSAEVAKALLEAGADVNAAATFMGTNLYQRPGVNEKNKNDPGLSVLQIAVQRGHADIVELLLESGADPNYDKAGYTALLWACGSWETSLDGVTGITPSKDHEWYQMGGLRDDKHKIIELLLTRGADPDARLKKSPPRYGFSPNPRPTGSTPYILAAIAGDARTMELLFEHGADPTLVPNNKAPAIILAAGVNRSLTNSLATEEGSLLAVQTALAHGARVTDTDEQGNTTLHGAALVRMPELVQFLVDEGADIHARNIRGTNPEYIASHELRGAGEVEVQVENSTLDLIQELSKPVTLTKAVEEWGELPPHVRKAVESLLRGELDRIAEAAAAKAKADAKKKAEAEAKANAKADAEKKE